MPLSAAFGNPYSADMHYQPDPKGIDFTTDIFMETDMQTNFDNREKPSQLFAAAVSVLITGLLVGAFEPMAQLLPQAEASVAMARPSATVQHLAPIVVTAKRV